MPKPGTIVCPMTGIDLGVAALGRPDETAPQGEAPFVAGSFADEAGFVAACKAARAAGRTNLQSWTPYAVHGLDPVLGLQHSLIGRAVFSVAILGFVLCFGMQYHLMVEDWPIIYSGRPYSSWSLWIVPTLELGLLLGALVNLFAAFHTCRLIPDPFSHLPDPRTTDDRFCLAISTAEAPQAELEAWFQAQGAAEVALFSAEKAKAEPEFMIPGQPAAKESIHA
jgi:hypothetical protein